MYMYRATCTCIEQCFCGFFKHNINLFTHRYPFILLGKEKKYTVKYYGHSQDLNPRSDDSAMRTQIQCTKTARPWHSNLICEWKQITFILQPDKSIAAQN